MGKAGPVLKFFSLLWKPLRKLRRRKTVRRTAIAAGLGLGMGAGKALSGRKLKKEDSDFNQKYSNFMDYVRLNDVPNKYRNNLNSVYKASSDTDYSEKIKNSLEIVDRMHKDKAIDKTEYRNLKEKLYSNFNEEFEEDSKKKNIEDYLPLAASVLFLLSGIFLLAPNPTGFSVLENFSRPSLNLFGVLSFILSMFFLLYFLRINKR